MKSLDKKSAGIGALLVIGSIVLGKTAKWAYGKIKDKKANPTKEDASKSNTEQNAA